MFVCRERHGDVLCGPGGGGVALGKRRARDRAESGGARRLAVGHNAAADRLERERLRRGYAVADENVLFLNGDGLLVGGFGVGGERRGAQSQRERESQRKGKELFCEFHSCVLLH